MLLGVVAATVIAGPVVGLIGAALAVATLDYFFLPERESFALARSDDVAAVIVMAVVLAALVVFVSYLWRTARRVRAIEAELVQSVEHMQSALLPGPVGSIPGVELGRCYRPAPGRHAGGDWYTIVPFGDGRIGLGIGDAEGHGLEAIGAMARSRFTMLAFALDVESPGDVLRRANRAVVTTAPPPGIFATATYGVIDVSAKTWTEACAGHPPTIVRRSSGVAEAVELHAGPPLGVDGAAEYDEIVIDLEELDSVVLYTDGLIERRDETIDQGIAVLCKQLFESADDLTERCAGLVNTLGNPDDDAAMLIARLGMIRAT
jgi:serine phosphatase RsbU (regulator of sigma subunit)